MRLSTIPAAMALAAFSASVPASALDRHDIEGIWRHPDTGSLILIYSSGGGISAKVVSTVDPNLKDVKNPDPALRSRPVAGVVLWERPKESGDLQWIGSAYNTGDGGTYYGTMHLTSPTTLAMSGCNLSAQTCADQIWTKADPQTAKTILTPVSQPKTAPAAAAPVAPVQAVTASAVPAPAAPKPAAVKPKQPPVKVVEKPKAPPATVEQAPKEVPESRPERPRDPNGYDELPHIHIR